MSDILTVSYDLYVIVKIYLQQVKSVIILMFSDEKIQKVTY